MRLFRILLLFIFTSEFYANCVNEKCIELDDSKEGKKKLSKKDNNNEKRVFFILHRNFRRLFDGWILYLIFFFHFSRSRSTRRMRQPVNLTYAHIHTQTHAGKPLTAAACCCCCCVGTRASYIQNVMHWGWAFFFFIRPSIRSRFKWIHAAARCCFKWNEWTVKREKNESTATTGVSTEQPVCAGYILTAHINYYFLYGGIKLEKKSPMWRANTVKQISVDLAVCPSTFESHDDILVSPQRTNEKKCADSNAFSIFPTK